MTVIHVDTENLEVNPESLIDELKIREQSDRNKVETMIEAAKEIVRPRFLYREVYHEQNSEDSICIEEIVFRSKVLRINLEGIYRVYPFVVTIGYEIEEWSSGFTDILDNYYANIVLQKILSSTKNYFYHYLENKYRLNKVSAMHPGSLDDWPIEEQKKLFSLLDNAVDEIGVQLTNSLLMVPAKSISGLAFPTEINFENCLLCLRHNCPGRRAQFDANLYHEKYGLE